MKQNKKLSKETIIQIEELFRSGIKKQDIANKLNIVISCVCKYTPKSRRQMDESDKTRIAELYEKGLTQIEIGNILGFSRDTVARVTKTLPKRKKPHREPAIPRVKRTPIVKFPKLKKLKVKVTKEKPNNLGKDVNIRKFQTKERPPLYKKIRLDNRTEIETYSEEEYLDKCVKYGVVL